MGRDISGIELQNKMRMLEIVGLREQNEAHEMAIKTLEVYISKNLKVSYEIKKFNKLFVESLKIIY